MLFALLIVAFGGSARRKGGVLEVSISARSSTSPRRGRLAFEAITLGHVIIGHNGQELEQLHRHELEHVRQYERWGTLFFLAYPISSLWQVMRGRRAYWDNYFEVQARARCAQKEGSS